ncbi:hypothetical protein ANANG_G00075840 [Anguilla anguilla]|uniref:Uncharacterized protein n=1 Tax=Anguilla anguilla TaxID=7936 RepID=A0A9D3MLC0_ANGAN|nr:hypothetical protein ANANG_G00075840 [Anguilla anguilla]
MTSGALLLLVVAVAVVTWKLWKKHGESAQANARARGGTNELTTVHPEQEVTYSTVFTKTRSSSRRMNSPQSQPSENPAGEVMYCSVILQNPQAARPPDQSAANSASDGIYSLTGPQKT